MKHFIYSTLYELKQAYLNLKQKPLFAFSVVSTMGITLGALLCVLTLAYVMLIKPLPYPEQDRLYVLDQQSFITDDKSYLFGFDYPTLVELYKKQKQFTQSAIIFQSEEVILSHPKQVLLNTSFVTPQWFSLFSVPMQLGRAFTSDEDLNKNIPVAILSYKTWQQDYASDADIINKTINVNDVSFKVIGVVDRDFVDPQLNKTGFDTQLWLPWDFNSIRYKKDWWGSYSSKLLFIGQLTNKFSLSQIKQQTSILLCTILQPRVEEGYSDVCQNTKIIFKSIKKSIVGDTSNTLYLLLAGVIALLIIAATNIINLFIAHIAEQQQTLAINVALGAKKSQLFRRLFYQASLLMLAATMLSFFIAVVGFSLLSHYLNSIFPLINTLSLQSIIIIPQIILSTLLAFAFAKLSINTLNYRQLNQNLAQSGKGSGIQISSKLRSLLIVSQISITSLLVFCCINLMINSFHTITKPLGYQRDNLSYLSVSISRTGANKTFVFEKDFALINQIKSSLLALPEVAAISVAESPIGSFIQMTAVDTSSNKGYLVGTSFGDENYFDIIGQHIIAGVNFPIQTKQDRDKLLIINEAFAKKLTMNGSAIGNKLDLSNNGSNIFTIIGIVNDIFQPGENKVSMQMYAPSSTLAAKFLIRYKKNQSLSREQLVNPLKKISSLLSVSQYKSLEYSYKWIVLPQRMTLVSSLIMTIISLFLAALGLYGILSYSTQMRRFEIGTRMAIGAKRGDVIKLIIKDNAKAILLGIAISVLALTALALSFSEQLSQYLTWQLIPLFLVTLGLVSLISFAACYLPLRQYINKPAVYSLKGSE